MPASTRSDVHGHRRLRSIIGITVLGLIATAFAIAGMVCLGLAGLLWSDGRFVVDYHWYELEGRANIPVAGVFFAGWFIVLAGATVRSFRQDLRALAAIVPLACAVLALALWPVLLAPGGASVVPL